MRKFICLSLLSVMLGMIFCLPALAEGAAVGPVASKEKVMVNEDFTVKVVVYEVYNLMGTSFELAFDPQKLAVTGGVYEGNIFAGKSYLALNEVDNNTGNARYTVLLKDFNAPFSGSGIIAGLNFKAVAGGEAMIAFKADSDICPGGILLSTGDSGAIPVEPFSAGIEIISGSSVRGKVYLEKTNPQDTDHSGILVTVMNEETVVSSTYTAADGSYKLADLPSGTYTVEYLKKGWSKVVRKNITAGGATVDLPALTLLIGDMNSDTYINVQDLLWVANYIGKRPSDPEWAEAQIADVNVDTFINVQDLLRVAVNIGKKPE